jgi:hypothetical protein
MIPRESPLLHIYDPTDIMIALTASVRRFNTPWLTGNLYQVPVHNGRVGLLNALDELVRKRKEFARAIFETHGSSGSISFGGERITGDTFRTFYNNRGYEKLFPYLWSRIYFNGCNVADNPNGWDFLDGAGSVFLKLGGGFVFAQTDVGRPVIFTGHVVHFGDSTFYSLWAPGGVFLGHSVD